MVWVMERTDTCDHSDLGIVMAVWHGWGEVFKQTLAPRAVMSHR
jgi:hypothetical protein